MSPKTYTAIEWIATGVESIAIGLTGLFGGQYAVAICSAIPLVKECVCSVCKLFVKNEVKLVNK